MKILFILFFSLPILAQNRDSKSSKKTTPQVVKLAQPDSNKYARIDNQLTNDSAQISSQQLADRFQIFSTEEAKVRAIYVWITKNIVYDVNQLFSFTFSETSDQSTDQLLRTRKGVCVDYASLFHELCTKVGLKAYIVEGYVKNGKTIGDFGHAWNAVRIANKWYLFDPTWGAGYVTDRTFVKKPNDVFFMISPEEFIYTHMPFDPLWQFLDYPITNQEFYSNKNKAANTSTTFHVNDSLAVYDQQTRLSRLESAEKRIEKNGNANVMTHTYLRDMKHEIVNTYYNRGVYAYNLTIKLLKDFINYRVARFVPLKSDEEIKKMVTDAKDQLNNTRKIVAEMPLRNKDITEKVAEINKLLIEVGESLKEQEQFLQRYFKAWKPLRKAML